MNKLFERRAIVVTMSVQSYVDIFTNTSTEEKHSGDIPRFQLGIIIFLPFDYFRSIGAKHQRPIFTRDAFHPTPKNSIDPIWQTIFLNKLTTT